MPTLLIHAGNALSEEDLMDQRKRAERLRHVERIIAGEHIAGIRIIERLRSSCVLAVSGDPAAVAALRQALEMKGIDTDENPPVIESMESGHA